MGYQTVVIQTNSLISHVEFSQCLWCWALTTKENAWQHETWHSQHPTLQPPIPEPLQPERVFIAPRETIAAIHHAIDGLYILLGEDPPFNEEPPSDTPIVVPRV